MRTMISSKGQIVLPAELRRQDRIHAGEQFDVERLDCGQYLLKKRSRRRPDRYPRLAAGPSGKGLVPAAAVKVNRRHRCFTVVEMNNFGV